MTNAYAMEKDLIGSQLVKKNDELAIQNGKISTLETTLTRGEKQYEQRLDEIRLLKLEINRLRREKNLFAKALENMTDLRLEVLNLERELNRERLRVRALEEALETPMNVHRWRKLEGTDPTTLELLDKIRILQKELLNKSQKLKESEKLHSTSKDKHVFQPTPNAQEELRKIKNDLSQKNEKIKCLSTEVSMKDTQIKDCKLDLDKMTVELNRYKGKFFSWKKLRDNGSVEFPTVTKLKPGTQPIFQTEVYQTNKKMRGGGFKFATYRED